MKELEELKKQLTELCSDFRFDSKEFKAFAAINNEIIKQLEILENGS